MKRLFLLSFAIGCAGGPARREVGTPDERRPELADRLRALGSELDDALAETDCDRVCSLARRICELADRICDISEEHPEEPGAGADCEDARARCERARREALARCGCRE